jgi:hypothetical protein
MSIYDILLIIYIFIGASYAVMIIAVAGAIQFPFISAWMDDLRKVDKRLWLLQIDEHEK